MLDQPGSFSMARYFFNLVSHRNTILDHEGVEISGDVEQSIERIIEEIRSEEPELFDVRESWRIEVVDGEGRKVANFPL
jgi:Domain of unknown function (DUF6894)